MKGGPNLAVDSIFWNFEVQVDVAGTLALHFSFADGERRESGALESDFRAALAVVDRLGGLRRDSDLDSDLIDGCAALDREKN
jgi:hypothetical protein